MKVFVTVLSGSSFQDKSLLQVAPGPPASTVNIITIPGLQNVRPRLRFATAEKASPPCPVTSR